MRALNTFFVFCVIVMTFLGIALAVVSVLQSHYHDTPPQVIGDCLNFPADWHPVAAINNPYQFLCRNNTSDQYRFCTAQYVTCEGE